MDSSAIKLQSLKSRPTDILVAVHGIGDQKRFATVRSVANRLAGSMALRAGGKYEPVAPQPLGYFHSDVRDLVEARVIDDENRLTGAGLAAIGVAEVFWADIPQEVVSERRTMEETKDWARTVVARAQALCQAAQATDPKGIVPPNFPLAAEVLDEMIETIYVLENFCAVAEKAGLFSFALAQVLEEYLGDVQVVAEFSYFRTDIVGRFHKAMEDIYAEQVALGNPGVRLHIVAHSEGTVVSFLGLLRAMSGHRLQPASAGGAQFDRQAGHPAWLKQVAGYMTIGSPIDKHLLLWPRIWTDLTPAKANELFRDRPIKWRNYYDYGDPVGFKLDTARLWLGPDMQGVTAFEFAAQHDHGFARYLLPGKAHNDYWDDPEVFEHFITEVVKPASPPRRPPQSKPLVAALSPSIPYMVSFAVLLAGAYLLYKQVGQFVHPEPEPAEAAQIYREFGIVRSSSVSGWELGQTVLGVAALVAGTSLIARLPRLAGGIKWKFIALLGFLTGCAAYCTLVQPESRAEIGLPFARFGSEAPTVGVCLLALFVGLFGLIATCSGKSDRRERWLWKGMRPLILCGTFGIALVLLGRLEPELLGGGTRLQDDELAFIDREAVRRPTDGRDVNPSDRKATFERTLAEARLTRAELNQFFGRADEKSPLDPQLSQQHLANLTASSPFLTDRPPVWPVVLAAAAFLYLWWLATLLFDLSFIWHRYVRASVANSRLHQWYRAQTSAQVQTETKP